VAQKLEHLPCKYLPYKWEIEFKPLYMREREREREREIKWSHKGFEGIKSTRR
jgi:hypothetical protein